LLPVAVRYRRTDPSLSRKERIVKNLLTRPRKKAPRFRIARLEERLAPSFAFAFDPAQGASIALWAGSALTGGVGFLAGSLCRTSDEERRHARPRSYRLAFDGLEGRIVPAVYTVNTLLDPSIAAGVNNVTGAINGTSGVVSLRSAIQAADSTPGGNTINVAVSGTIHLTPGTPGETDNQAGELVITNGGGNLSINNTSGGTLAVDAGLLSRVFINPTQTFTATLNNAQQVPANNSTATGTATLVFNPDQSTITVSSTFKGLAAPPTGAHLHIAPAGQNAVGGQPVDANGNPETNADGIALDANGNPIIFPLPLPGTITGTLGPQTFTVTPAFVAQLEAGNVYENIHDAVFPAGEIRSQFTAPAPFTVTMTGFTIQNGFAQPGAGPTGSGGGIRDQGNVSLTLTNMTLTNNTATADGGGVAMENQGSMPWTLTLNNTTVSNNHAGDAGGGVETDGSGKVFVNGGSISNDTAVNQGAGIWLDAIQPTQGAAFQGANLTVTGTSITGNRATSATGGVGGGIGNAGDGTVSITDSSLTDNTAGLTGGGFGDQNAQGTLTVLDSLFLDNSATTDGGGIAAGGPLTTIAGSEIKGNISGATGGGIFANGVTLAVQSSTIADNLAAGNGGGVELETTGTGAAGSTITDSTITGNSAVNNAGADGGGIEADSGFTGDLTLTSDTINANKASVGGGIFWAGTMGSTVSVEDTIIAGNSAVMGPDAASNLLFTAALTATAQGNTATGTASILLSPDQTMATVNLSWSNLFGIATQALIQTAPANSPNAGVVFTLAGVPPVPVNPPFPHSGTVGPQTFAITAAQVAQLQAGNLDATVYSFALNVNFPEIRGQFTRTGGAFNDLGGNLIGVAGVGSGNISFTKPATQTGSVGSPLDPMLAALADNGGPLVGASGTALTLETVALLPGSPALDKGVNAGAPNTDERGFTRPDAGKNEVPDVGAFEFQDVTLAVKIIPASPTVSLGSSDTFAVVVTNTSGNALPADNTTVTVTLPAGLGGGTQTFTVGALAAGRSATFIVPGTGRVLGPQSVTAAVTSPDATPNSVSASATVTAVLPPAPVIPSASVPPNTVLSLPFAPALGNPVFIVVVRLKHSKVFEVLVGNTSGAAITGRLVLFGLSPKDFPTGTTTFGWAALDVFLPPYGAVPLQLPAKDFSPLFIAGF
jgi:predicted outer membrane repeat protein